MEKFLDDYYIFDPYIRAIAVELEKNRREKRSRYSQTITQMSSLISLKKPKEQVLVVLARGAISKEIASLANNDLDKFLEAWKSAVMLMKAKWGTAH